jgi:hypothetical protein
VAEPDASGKKGLPDGTTAERYMEYYLPRALNRHAEKLPDFDVCLAFALAPTAADPGGSFTLRVASRVATVEAGAALDAPCTISATADDWLELVRGRLNGPIAFMMGRIKVEGDFGLALRLGQMVATALSDLR